MRHRQLQGYEKEYENQLVQYSTKLAHDDKMAEYLIFIRHGFEILKVELQ